jgi:hypothetical protein
MGSYPIKITGGIMSDQQDTPKGQGIVKPYLGFIDNSVLFKKPISCLFAIVSLLIPVYVLILFIQDGIFRANEAKFIIAGILIVAILLFAGIFGFLIWWHRRITRDEGGHKWYSNFRRFIQTIGEWLGTFTAISVFGCVLVLTLVLSDEHYMLTGIFSVPNIDIVVALHGLIAGFLIIIATRILLFLLDPVIWLIKQIWKLIVRVVLFAYRCVINAGGLVEKNTPFWIGLTWLLAFAAVVSSLVLCFIYGGISPVIALAVSLGFMGYLLYKRKNYDA